MQMPCFFMGVRENDENRILHGASMPTTVMAAY